MTRGEEVQGSRRGLAFVLLLGVVMVWGSTFAVVKDALQDASPLLFNLVRFLLAAMVLLAVSFRGVGTFSQGSVRGGMLAGALLAAGYELQTLGLARTSAVHSAFLTGLVVVLVPLLSLVPGVRAKGHPRPGWQALLGAAVAFTGLFLMTTPADVSVGTAFSAVGLGDLLTMGCAVAFAGHLLSLSRLAHLPAKQLAPLQIVFCALTMAICLPMGGRVTMHATTRLGVALTITAVLGTAGAFWVQTWSQKHLPAATTAMVLTVEPVFALLVSMIFLGERLSIRSGVGAGLILTGIAVTELLSPTTPVTFEPS